MFKFVVAAFVLCCLSLPAYATQETQKVQGGAVCELCTLVLGTAQNLLEQNKTENEVLQFIEKNLCGRLGALNATCVQYMETEGREILYELSQKIDPSIVCHKIGLCVTADAQNTVQLVFPQKPKEQPKAGPVCELCQLVLGAAKQLVQNNATDSEVITFIEKELCSRLGGLSDTCVSFLETTGREILADLANGLDPETVCKKFGLCAASVASKQLNSNPIECTICQYVVQFIQIELQGNKTEAAIVSVLENVCKIVPSSLRDKCDNLIDTYGVYLVQLLFEFSDPLAVCQAIKVC